MPSRRIVLLVVLFWLLTTAYVAYKDVWPRLFASGPPAVAIDLADEAAQMVYVRWTIYRDAGEKIGKLTSFMNHVDADDTFWFITEYREVKLQAGGLRVEIPELTTGVRVTRAGDLREERVDGKMEAYFGLLKLGPGKGKVADASVHIRGTVVDGRLLAACRLESSLGRFDRDLEPVPVPQGQPLNPLLPVNRLQHLKPGHRWHVQMSSPLDDALASLARQVLRESGLQLPDRKAEPLFAQVLPDPQPLDWNNQPVPCWVIEFRRDEVVARTWVRVTDGRVLQQQAVHGGEQLTIVRE
jgi:hypothetical protein